MTTNIKLYGGTGARFEEINTQLSREFGYEPTNPEVLGYLMATYDTGSSGSSRVTSLSD